MRGIIAIILILFMFGCSYKDVTITGRVYKDQNKNDKYDNGEPQLPGVLVQSGNLQTRTANDGSFSITGKIVGNDAEIKLFFSKEGYKIQIIKVVIQPGGEGETEISFYDLNDNPLNEIVMQSNN